MTKKEIIAYVMETPYNTNFAILEQMLDMWERELSKEATEGLIDTSEGNVVATDIKSGKIAFAKGQRMVGTNTFDANTQDANAIAADIKKGKTAYVKGTKVTGSFVELNTADATATAADILKGKTAYVNGKKIVGTLEVVAQ